MQIHSFKSTGSGIQAVLSNGNGQVYVTYYGKRLEGNPDTLKLHDEKFDITTHFDWFEEDNILTINNGFVVKQYVCMPEDFVLLVNAFNDPLKDMRDAVKDWFVFNR